MPKRITVPDDHVALILPEVLSDELMSLLRELRKTQRRIVSAKTTEETKHNAQERIAVAGDVMLAILEAKE